MKKQDGPKQGRKPYERPAWTSYELTEEGLKAAPMKVRRAVARLLYERWFQRLKEERDEIQK
jgi:hypothetical protein